MTSGFEDFAEGRFTCGLQKLHVDEQWADNNCTLDGPFWLGFPGKRGWGEAVLIASLLKRQAVSCNTRLDVFSGPQVCSILKHETAFAVRCVKDYCEARRRGARSPLAIIKDALTGNLLKLPFQKISTCVTCKRSSHTTRRLGIAWASVQKKRIKEKSIPIHEFNNIILDVVRKATDVQIVSFQRGRSKIPGEFCDLKKAFLDGVCCIDDKELDSENQADIVRKISDLDCMLTISTTTAHIAAALGIPVVLLAAKRAGPQWFWRAQKEQGKCFYPSVEVILGAADNENWWEYCIQPAQKALAERLRPQATTSA